MDKEFNPVINLVPLKWPTMTLRASVTLIVAALISAPVFYENPGTYSHVEKVDRINNRRRWENRTISEFSEAQDLVDKPYFQKCWRTYDVNRSNRLPTIPTHFSFLKMNVSNDTFCEWNHRQLPINCSCNHLTLTGSFFHGCCEGRRPSVSHNRIFEVLRQWENKTVLFVGDSLTQQTVDALMIEIQLAGLERSFTKKTLNISNPGRVYTCFLPRHNVSIQYLMNYRLEINPAFKPTQKGSVNDLFAEQKRILPYAVFEESIRSADISYINFGLHHSSDSEWLMDILYSYAKFVLETDIMQSQSRKKHFYRLTYPQHFQAPDENVAGSYSGTLYANCGSHANEHNNNRIERKHFHGSLVSVLDYHSFLSWQGDLHSLANQRDCSHWCWNPWMWDYIWSLKIDALRDMDKCQS